jgi:hypothetical protein
MVDWALIDADDDARVLRLALSDVPERRRAAGRAPAAPAALLVRVGGVC